MATIHDSNGNGIGQDNPLAVRQVQSDVILPVDIQSHYATTIQTHNAVSVPITSWSLGASWLDTDGFDKISITLMNDASTDSYCEISWSNDGINSHGTDANLLTGTLSRKAGTFDTKARYCKINLKNNDATLAHTMSAWAYLKA